MGSDFGRTRGHRPGMTFLFLSEDVNVRTALSDTRFPSPALPAAPPYAPLPIPARYSPEPRRPPGSCRSVHVFI